ncbi:MAG: carboxypeptidase-like regulatory domain-containing protein [Bryobacteraceae bacterium]|nr:carboxypeptidase-like regulatory domain-containing protein [Bryobacteraceae bacterium]
MKLRVALLSLVAAAGLMAKNAEGVVMESNGSPVTGATVLLKGVTDSSVRSAVTREDGTFVFVGLSPEADYEVRARLGEKETKPASISRFDNKVRKIELKFPADRK